MLKRKLTLLLIVLGSAAGCAKEEEAPAAEPAVPVQVAEVQRLDVRRIVIADGIVYPVNQASIVPKISAPIRAFHVKRGDHVASGQLIAELENKDLSAAAAESRGLYTQAEAAYRSTTAGSVPEELLKAQREVESAKQSMDAAEKVHTSRQELLRQGALAQRLVDEANLNYVQARNQYDVAQKHLESLQNVGQGETIKNAEGQLAAAKAKNEGADAQLSYAQIVSPISGVVSDRPLFPGEMAAAGAPLATVMDISRVIARAKIPSAQLPFIKVGNPATIAVAGISAEVSGRVTVISPALDSNSTTAEVWVEAANPNETLRPGVTATVSIVTGTVKNAVVVPTASLLPSAEGKTIVMVVGTDSVAHEHEVEIGIREPDKVQVTKGLEGGERVVIAGGLGVEDGTKVQVQETKEEEKK